MVMSKLKFLFMAFLSISQSIYAQEDKYLWLEEVDGEKALSFVNEKNNATINVLSAEKDYQSIYNQSLQIYNSADKIAYPNIKGKYVYNFWKDKDHERGIWRRCLLVNYSNKKYDWETLLDIDELSKKDNIKWVFKGSSGLYPSYSRFLISLSNGGGDAVVIKEFDVEKKQFVENGFFIPESKGGASYVDENTLCVSSDFGEGTMTTSGYPTQTKLWRRGTSLKDAQLIYEGTKTDVGAWGGILRDGNNGYVFISRAITFFTSKYSIWVNNKMISLDVPEDCAISGLFHNQLLVQLKSDWTVGAQTYTTGSLVSKLISKLFFVVKSVSERLEY